MLIKQKNKLIVLDTNHWINDKFSEIKRDRIYEELERFNNINETNLNFYIDGIESYYFCQTLPKSEQIFYSEYIKCMTVIDNARISELYYSVEEVLYIVNGHPFFTPSYNKGEEIEPYNLEHIKNMFTKLKKIYPECFIKYKDADEKKIAKFYCNENIIDYLLRNLKRLNQIADKKASIYTRSEVLTLTRSNVERYLTKTFQSVNNYENSLVVLEYSSFLEKELKNKLELSYGEMSNISNYRSYIKEKLLIIEKILINSPITNLNEFNSVKREMFKELNKVSLNHRGTKFFQTEFFLDGICKPGMITPYMDSLKPKIKEYIDDNYFGVLLGSYAKSISSISKEIKLLYNVKLSLDESSKDYIVLRKFEEEIRHVTNVIKQDKAHAYHVFINIFLIDYSRYFDIINMFNRLEDIVENEDQVSLLKFQIQRIIRKCY